MQANAKLNVILRVLERETDGYHRLETVFQRIALADSVTVRIASSRSLDVQWGGPAEDLGPVEQNLAWRAALAYRSATGWPDHWAIEIVKRIPVRAGLGGGSANAAAVLRALNQMSPAPLDAAPLQRVGATLGSDVPFLVSGESLAIGRGHGEEIEPLPELPRASVVVVVPEFGVSTAEAYAALDRARAASGHPPRAHPLSAATLTSWQAVAAQQQNDFEPTVFAEHPELAEVRAHLEESGALIARLSGSGSALFGLHNLPTARTPPPHPRTQTITTHTT